MPLLFLLVARRVALGLSTLAAVAVLIYFGTQLLPGDVAQTILGHQATPESVAALRHQLHLDRPLLARFAEWVAALAHGDLGMSLANGTPVSTLVGERLANTFFLAAVAGIIAVPLSLSLGIASVVFRGSLLDRGVSAVSLSFISVPEFVTGYVLVSVISVWLRLLPNLSEVYAGIGWPGRLRAIALPCATLVLAVSAHMIRMTRVAILNVMDTPFIEMARLKGLSPVRVVGVHAMANAVAPVATVVVLNLAYLIVGVVVVEVVFVYPGMGQLIVDSVAKRDIPVVQACGLIFGATYILLNIVADVISLLANPRIRYPR